MDRTNSENSATVTSSRDMANVSSICTVRLGRACCAAPSGSVSASNQSISNGPTAVISTMTGPAPPERSGSENSRGAAEAPAQRTAARIVALPLGKRTDRLECPRSHLRRRVDDGPSGVGTEQVRVLAAGFQGPDVPEFLHAAPGKRIVDDGTTPVRRQTP